MEYANNWVRFVSIRTIIFVPIISVDFSMYFDGPGIMLDCSEMMNL